LIDLSVFEEGSVIGQSERVVTQVHQRRSDRLVTVVKTISVGGLIEGTQIETEMENQMNLRHPMIGPLIGCVFGDESSGMIELKTMRLYADGSEGSLADVLLNEPVWWTPTAKAKAIVGIALGLRYAHGHGLLHGSVKASNILFDGNHRIQIADFSPIRLYNGSVAPFSGAEGAEWSPAIDISGFASLLSAIAVDRTANSSISSICAMDDPLHNASVPAFIRTIIEMGQSPKSHDKLSFIEIINRLKANNFEISPGVDTENVSTFVTWIESSEETGEWE
jgi:serine/threonine protein kinase